MLEVSFTTNAKEAERQIAKEKQALDASIFKGIRRASLETFFSMVRGAPVRTGNYRANMRLAINEKPGVYRITGKRAGIPLRTAQDETVLVDDGNGGTKSVTISAGSKLRGYRAHDAAMLKLLRPYYDAVEKQHEDEASKAWDGKRLKDIHTVWIYNDAAHAHFVERGGPNQRAYYIFGRGEQTANSKLSAINVK